MSNIQRQRKKNLSDNFEKTFGEILTSDSNFLQIEAKTSDLSAKFTKCYCAESDSDVVHTEVRRKRRRPRNR